MPLIALLALALALPAAGLQPRQSVEQAVLVGHSTGALAEVLRGRGFLPAARK